MSTWVISLAPLNDDKAWDLLRPQIVSSQWYRGDVGNLRKILKNVEISRNKRRLDVKINQIITNIFLA